MSDITAPAAPAAPAPEGPADPAGSDQQPQQNAEQKAAAEQRHRLKIRGRDSEYTLEEMRKLAEKGGGADEIFQESAKMRKEASELMDKLRKDPNFFVKHPEYGPALRQAVEMEIYEEIETASLSPEQKRLRELEKKEKQWQEDQKRQEDEKTTQRQQMLKARFADQFDKMITGALEKSDIPKTPGAVKRMLSYLDYAVKNDIPVTQDDLVSVVYEDFLQEFKSVITAAKGKKDRVFLQKMLDKLLDEDVRTFMRESDLKKVRSTQSDRYGAPAQQQTSASKPARKLSGSDWRADMMKNYPGK